MAAIRPIEALMLRPEQIREFQTCGYTILEGFKTKTEVAALKAAATEIVDAFDVEALPSTFATGRDEALDDYFLSSGDKVRCFLEPDALDEAGRLRHAKDLSINKIGHALHDLDPAFDQFSRDPRLASVVADLGVVQPQIWQSMYIYKQPHIGGEVMWHQDATYLSSDPQSVVALWFALDDATCENGCLWAANCGVNTPLRAVFQVSGAGPQTTILDDTPWPDLHEAVPLEVAAGTLVCFSGLLPHYSAANTSGLARHAYTMHVVDGRAEYAAQNWIQRRADFPVRGFESV
jgi:phytanoyl-CoA hydroxylase